MCRLQPVLVPDVASQARSEIRARAGDEPGGPLVDLEQSESPGPIGKVLGEILRRTARGAQNQSPLTFYQDHLVVQISRIAFAGQPDGVSRLKVLEFRDDPVGAVD